MSTSRVITVFLLLIPLFISYHIIDMYAYGYWLKYDWTDLRKDGEYGLHFMPIFHRVETKDGTIDEGLALFFGHYSLLIYFEKYRK